MIDGLIALLILVLVVGIIYWLMMMLIEAIPMGGNFKSIAKLLLLGICVLILLARALPLLGVHVL